MTRKNTFYIYQPHFFGGMSRLCSEGLNKYRFYNGEDIDIFSEMNYIQPSIIFQIDNILDTYNVTGFTMGSTGKLYALGQNATPKATVNYRTTPSGASPTDWTALFISDNYPATHNYSPITAFQTTETTKKEYLYYHTSSGTAFSSGTAYLSRYGDLLGSPTETVTFGTLTGLNETDKLCHLVHNGELFVANGNKVTRVTSVGNFVEATYTLPSGLRVVDMIPMVLTTGGDYLALLCSDSNNPNQSQVIIWDIVATSGYIAKVRIPVAKPQWIQKVGSIYLIAGVNPNNKLEIYALSGLISTDSPIFVIDDVSYSLTRPVSSVNTKYTMGNVFHFGVEGTTKSGIYAISEVEEDKPAMTLLHRCATTDYSKHRPLALLVTSDAKYLSYYDNGNYRVAICNAQNPTYSSNAVLDTLLYHANTPYVDKSWEMFQIGIESLPIGCSIGITARKNLTDSFANINSSLSEVSTAYTELQDIFIEGFMGRQLQLRLSFTSNVTSRAKVRFIGLSGIINYLI